MADSPPDHDITTTTTRQLRCPVCWTQFTRIRRQKYCSDNCRKTVWGRHRAAVATSAPPPPPPSRRRDATVYACPSCDSRFHGQQWCHDCNQPCTRVGLGGLCPHCDEPVAITDLFDPQEALRS
jgi:predicted amidophosphoribosyltransferase